MKIPKDAYESKLLKEDDLNDDITLVKITGFETQDLPQTGQTYCIKTDVSDKPLALNKTNLRTLISLFGDNTADWVGKPVKLAKIYVNNPQTNTETLSLRIKEAVQPKSK